MISDREHSIDQGSKRARFAINCAVQVSWLCCKSNSGIEERGRVEETKWHFYEHFQSSPQKSLSLCKSLSHTRTQIHTHTLLIYRSLSTERSHIYSILAPPTDTTAHSIRHFRCSTGHRKDATAYKTLLNHFAELMTFSLFLVPLQSSVSSVKITCKMFRPPTLDKQLNRQRSLQHMTVKLNLTVAAWMKFPSENWERIKDGQWKQLHLSCIYLQYLTLD